MRKIAPLAASLLILGFITSATPSLHEAIALEPPAPAPPSAQEGNLLINGDMDNPNYPFYWRYPNHYVAGMWFEWFSINIPEFIDGGILFHNSCYPVPPPGETCESMKQHSQGYIRWGGAFAAGNYHHASVTPCLYYKFEAYNHNDALKYHPKVGLDPTGQGLPIPPGGYSTPNCPPDYHSPCPDPGVDNLSDLPPNIVWSPEFDHEPYTWAPQSVVAEALSTTVTVWTFAWPEQEVGPSFSVYWDNASLVHVPPANGLLVPSGTLPAPDGGITNVVSGTLLGTAVFKWDTSQLALSQILYHYVGPAGSSSLPPLATDTSQFESQTAIDTNLSTSHLARLNGLSTGAVYDVALLSRRWMDNQCQTSIYLTRIQTSELLVPLGALPSPDGRISNVMTRTVFNAATLQWQTSEPAYSQVLYHYVGPATTTLPSIVKHTQNFEMKTAINTVTRTAHLTKLYKLQPMSVYDVAILSCTVVDGLCEHSSAHLTRVQTNDLIVPDGKLPAPNHEITGPIVLPFEDSAYVIWQSSHPSYGQVLYDDRTPPTSTLSFTPTAHVYLPIIQSSTRSNGSSSDYAFRTWPVITPTTLHVVQISGLVTESQYVAVALSAWSEGDQDFSAASSPVAFRTGESTQPAGSLQMFSERLQACLATTASRDDVHLENCVRP